MANIDTLKYYELLIEAGNTTLEAKAHVYATGNGISDLVTKEDLKHLENRIDYKLNVIKKLDGSLLIAIFILLLKVAIWG